MNQSRQVYTNGELTTIKAVVDRLAAERRYSSAQTKVGVMRLHQELTRQCAPIQAAIADLVDQHSDGGSIAPGTDSYDAYVRAVTELMQAGEVAVECEPLRFADLTVRSPEGELEPVDLSPAEMAALGPLLDYSE